MCIYIYMYIHIHMYTHMTTYDDPWRCTLPGRALSLGEARRPALGL